MLLASQSVKVSQASDYEIILATSQTAFVVQGLATKIENIFCPKNVE